MPPNDALRVAFNVLQTLEFDNSQVRPMYGCKLGQTTGLLPVWRRRHFDDNLQCWNKIRHYIHGGPDKVRPTYIFDGNIWMHRQYSINFGKCDNSNSGTHLGKHKSLIFNIIRQMAAPRLGIFALVIFLILLTRTYSHRPIILRFQEFNKFYGKIVCL